MDLHKIQCAENRLVTKFNMRKTDSSQNLIVFMFYIFWRALHPAPLFLEVTNELHPFLEVKNKPCPF